MATCFPHPSGGLSLGFGTESSTLSASWNKRHWPGLQDAPGCLTSPCVELFGLSPGNRQERHVGTGAAVNLSPLFLFLGRRRGPWPTNTGLALRIWSSASPAPRHSRPWSAALTATPTRPRLVALVVIGSAPRLLVLTSVWATAGPVSLRGFGPCP